MAKGDLKNLESAVQGAAAASWTPPAATEQTKKATPRRSKQTEPRKAATREDTANISAHLARHYQHDLKDICNGRSRDLGRLVPVQEVIAEALDDLFKKYRRYLKQ